MTYYYDKISLLLLLIVIKKLLLFKMHFNNKSHYLKYFLIKFKSYLMFVFKILFKI